MLARQRDIASGKVKPFAAVQPVLVNEGHVVISKGQSLSNEQILNMNWLVHGVQGKINR